MTGFAIVFSFVFPRHVAFQRQPYILSICESECDHIASKVDCGCLGSALRYPKAHRFCSTCTIESDISRTNQAMTSFPSLFDDCKPKSLENAIVFTGQ